jgi:flagellar motor switch protein FliN/FliY
VSDAKVEKVELEELDVANVKDKLVGAKNLDVVRDVEVRLTAVLGGTTLSVGEMFNLQENSVLTLDALVDQPVDLLLNQQIVARGALVIADDNFAVQITEIPDSGQA